MKKTTIIIPVHTLNKELSEYLAIAINSIAVQEQLPEKVFIVAKKDKKILGAIEIILEQFKDSGLVIEVIENSGKTDYCSQVNLGVENVKTEWFSVLNFDDAFNPTWFKNYLEYREIHPELSAILPIIRETTKESGFIGFQNEAIWAAGFGEEMGVLTYDTLLDFSNFSFDGGFFKTEKVKEIGGLKSNIVLAFTYEFLLRAATNGLRIGVVPKIGYVRLNGREDSLTANYVKTLNNSEIKWWFSVAKKEHFFTEDRKIDTSFINDQK